MQSFSKPHTFSDKKLLLFFIGGWVLLNLLQAAQLGIDGDEAYYWLYARHLQWGYFDHPPMIALFIKLGETLGHGAFFTRLATVLFSAGTVYFGYKMLPPRYANVRLYLLLFSSVALFHVYSFIATPDGPLLFFTTFFFYAYRKYLDRDSVAHTLLLALAITGMLYSKYHGILPVFFTVLSHPKLLWKRSAWAVVVLVTLAFAPHLWWQYGHDWPTLRYHLFERMGSAYKFSKTGNYLAGQLFIWGLLTTIPALYLFIKTRFKNTTYERAHVVTFWGVLLFFLLSSLGNNIQVHWTLVAGPSFLVLLQRVLSNASLKLQQLFTRLLRINIALILLARLVFIIPHSPVLKIHAFKALADARSWTTGIYQAAQGRPVVFTDSYRLPALYLYYHPDATAWGYNTIDYRKTQFNIFSDAFLNNALVLMADHNKTADSTHFLKTPYNTLYLYPTDSFHAVNNLKLTWKNNTKQLGRSRPRTVVLSLENTGADAVSTTGLSIAYTFYKSSSELFTPTSSYTFPEKMLPPGYKKEIELPMQLPEKEGTYRLVFSIVQPRMAGNFASPFYKVRVE